VPVGKKRKYTFRKGEAVPYESGSIIHESVKSHRAMARNLSSALDSPKKRKRKQSLF